MDKTDGEPGSLWKNPVLYVTFPFFACVVSGPGFFKLTFYLSWRAYSFPLAAITLASVQLYHSTGAIVYKNLIIITMVLLAITVGLLVFFTIAHIVKKNICIEEA